MNDTPPKKPTTSTCNTYHIDSQGLPAYSRRFTQVLPFHEPGLAPVCKENLAWHIKLDGEDAYSARFEKTFGFYCSAAAVSHEKEWFHITPDGTPLYSERYDFVGNFQNNYCVVCNTQGNYFHINLKGEALYSSRWSYCGDFREGSAVVQRRDGLSTHIDTKGELIHDSWFLDLDVYHKGFARAKDTKGWHHINKKGQPIYSNHYSQIEPFYNGQSRVEAFDGSLLIIDEAGILIRELRPSRRNYFTELSNDMVGYWSTLTLGATAELAIIDHLPASSFDLAQSLNIDLLRLERLLRALTELDIVKKTGANWSATLKGQYLNSNHTQTLKSAAIEYSGDLLDRWRTLPAIIRGEPVTQDIFESVAADPLRRKEHHRMLASYALYDYPKVIDLLGIQPNDVVFDAAGGTGALSQLIKRHYPEAQVICGDISAVTSTIENIENIDFDLFKPWPINSNKIVLARVLHDWNDIQAVQILKYAKASLLPNGEILILEMVLPEIGNAGALCDLHLLTVTGGQERRLSEYIKLFENSSLSLKSQDTGSGLVCVLRLGASNEQTPSNH